MGSISTEILNGILVGTILALIGVATSLLIYFIKKSNRKNDEIYQNEMMNMKEEIKNIYSIVQNQAASIETLVQDFNERDVGLTRAIGNLSSMYVRKDDFNEEQKSIENNFSTLYKKVDIVDRRSVRNRENIKDIKEEIQEYKKAE